MMVAFIRTATVECGKKRYNSKHILKIQHTGFVGEQEVHSEKGKRESVSSKAEEKFGDRNVKFISHVLNMKYQGDQQMEWPK